MKSENKTLIQQAFTRQAARFESEKMNFSKQEYLDYAIAKIAPKSTESVLEVAAGTCACGRAFAPKAGSVVCLDMTPAMLNAGRIAAERAGIHNMTFVLGDAAELPFLNDSFDVVFSRLAFHHFPDAERPFAEMVRTLKPDGRLAMIDMEAAENDLRDSEDRIETLRDPSHVRNLSKSEMLELYEKHGFRIECCETVRMSVNLENWMEHTETPEDVRKSIRALAKDELAGKTRTGMHFYRASGKAMFDQRWVLIIGKR